MSCSKNDFLDIYMKLGIKDLQSQVDVNTSYSSYYTPNVDFLNSVWDDYLYYGCSSLASKIDELSMQLSNMKVNTSNYKLNAAKIFFLEKIERKCGCKNFTPIEVEKIIKGVDFNKDSLPASGGYKAFKIIGDQNAVFNFFITNGDGEFYDFENSNFSSTQNILSDLVIKEQEVVITVDFPSTITTDTVNGDFSSGATAITMDSAVATKMSVGDRVTGTAVLDTGNFTVASIDSTNVFSLSASAAIDDEATLYFSGDDYYDITIVARPEHNTRHATYNEVLFADRTIDVNSSSGSTSANLKKRIYQYTDNVVTLSAISANSLSVFGSSDVVNDTVTPSKRGGIVKFPFTITWTAHATKGVYIKTQPGERNTGSYVERTIGAAALPIEGEDVSSSTYYRWPLDNIVGIKNGMRVMADNMTAYSIVGDYIDKTEIKAESPTRHVLTQSKLGSKTSKLGSKYNGLSRGKSIGSSLPITTTHINVSVPGVETTGDPTVTDGIVTAQAGNIVFNKKQVDALKDDDVKIIADGPSEIKSLTGYEFKITNLKAELTKPTTTTTEATSKHATIAVADREGVINDVSRVSGVGIDSSSDNPTLTTGGGLDGAGDWIMDAVQTLENGVTLTVENTGRIVTITGDIEFSQIGEDNVTIFFDVEQFLATS